MVVRVGGRHHCGARAVALPSDRGCPGAAGLLPAMAAVAVLLAAAVGAAAATHPLGGEASAEYTNIAIGMVRREGTPGRVEGGV